MDGTRYPLSDYVTLVEVMERTTSFEELAGVLQTALRRLETEGIRALVSINFYADTDTTEVGAILTFADRHQMLDHINLIADWPEFKQLLHVVKPIEVRVYGQPTPEVEAWLQKVIHIRQRYAQHIAGFVR